MLLRVAVVPFLLLPPLVGCGGGLAPSRVVPPPADEGTISAGPPQLAEGVTAMEPTCTEGAEERCDALDSDCDGRIDEGCPGAQGGFVDVAVAWTGGADLDLLLDGPDAAGALAVSSRGACGEPVELPVERRSLESAPAGRYVVALRYADGCGTDGGVTASVTVSVDGQIVGTFNREVAPESTSEVVVFELAAN